MKRILLAVIALLALPVLSHGATVTTRTGLVIPTYGDQSWDVPLRTDFNLVDSTFAALGQSNIFSGANTFNSNFTASGGVTFGDASVQTTAFSTVNDTISTATITNLYVGSGSGNVANLWKYRRPNSIFLSTNTVTIETGTVDGSTNGSILFPDGQLRNDATAGHIVLDTRRLGGWLSGGTIQSGMQNGTIQPDTWESVVAVKSQANSTDFVLIATTLAFTPANYAVFNSTFGTNGWVPIAYIAYGDNVSATSGIVAFVQDGNHIAFNNVPAESYPGIRYVHGNTSPAVTWTYATGMSAGGNVPNDVLLTDWCVVNETGNTNRHLVTNAAGTITEYLSINSANGTLVNLYNYPTVAGIALNTNSVDVKDIKLIGFTMGALGIGSNPLM